MAAVEVVGVVILCACAALLGLVLRRRLLDRSGGTVDMSLRTGRHGRPPHGSLHWAFGVARYDGDKLLWFKTFSLAPRPRLVLRRSGLVIHARRQPHGAEALAVIADATILDCTYGDEVVELAVPSPALPGLLAWVEAAPQQSFARHG